MARDRKRAKQRQQERREERLKRMRDGDGEPEAEAEAEADAKPPEADPPTERKQDPPSQPDSDPEPDLLEQADLEVGAPPEDVGRSDRTLREDPPAPSFETDDETLADPSTAPPKGVERGGESLDTHKRGRLAAFLVAVWAELQRVQWPDRKALTQLTGVVLFFVLIVGAYLGGLDAIFSRLIQAIL
jgi:preprotein translocase subunit SecE